MCIGLGCMCIEPDTHRIARDTHRIEPATMVIPGDTHCVAVPTHVIGQDCICMGRICYAYDPEDSTIHGTKNQ